MNSNVKGAVAEQAIVLAAMKIGVPVLRPVCEHGRVDLGLDIGGRLWRVQCKWGNLTAQRDVVAVHLFSSRCTPSGYVRTSYAEHEVDLFGVYCAELDRCFLIPISLLAGMQQIYLRLTPLATGRRHALTLPVTSTSKGL